MIKLKVGIVGAGVFGTYHAQKAAASPHADLVGIFDQNQVAAARVADTYGRAAFPNFEQLLAACDAVVIAVPASYHEAMVRQALYSNCHALVEKPLALNAISARSLSAEAIQRGLVLQVGHQERFVAKEMGLFKIDEPILEMESVRVSPRSPEGRAEDVSVIWDLMIHDLDLTTCLIKAQMASLEATGAIHHSKNIDEADCTFQFKNGAKARLYSSRAADERQRTMRFIFPSGEINVDFLTRKMTNTTDHPLKVDISAHLPDPLGAADESFYAACLGTGESAVPGHGTVASVMMAEAAEAKVLASL